MNWYKSVKLYYDWGIYTDAQVYRFVELDKITQEEAETIIGNTPNE